MTPLTLGSVLTLVGGKGGVGKTTTAAALGVALADAGREVVVVSVDPAHSLGDALGVTVGPDPTAVPGVARLSALEIDPDLERRRFLSSRRAALLSLLERGTYLDSADAGGLVDLTIPGMDELAALFRLQSLLATQSYLVVDTAPTGHALRLLDLPELARGWLGALQAMEDKSRTVSTALVGSYRPDEASELLSRLDQELASLSNLLRDAEKTRFVLVTGREPVVLAETMRYQEELSGRRIAVGGVVVNRASRVATAASEVERRVFVPPLRREPVGVDGLREFAEWLGGGHAEERGAHIGRSVTVRPGEIFVPPLDRVLYMVSGKGGVGKSTVSAALALRLQREGRRVLLLSVDPAGSLGEVLGMAVEAQERPIPGAEGLWARQLEAVKEWEEFRTDYQAEAERLFRGLLVSAGAPGSDRAVVERLVDLAPPGIDELAAVMEVVDMTEDRPYDALVLDTAPTGHFLRLLELPAIALGWTHQVMRLLLKYRHVVAPGDLAERLLKLARSLRAFSERLRDPAHCWLLIVALPEALSGPETNRLLARVRDLGIDPGALLVNRSWREEGAAERVGRFPVELSGVATGLPLLAAPELEAGPQGVEALSRFVENWRIVNLPAPVETREDSG